MKLSAATAEHMTTDELQHYLALDLIEMPSAEQLSCHLTVNLSVLVEEVKRKDIKLADALDDVEELTALVEEMREKLNRVSPRRKPLKGGLRMLVY